MMGPIPPKGYVETIWYHAVTDQLGLLRVWFTGGAEFEVETETGQCEVPHVPLWLVAHGWERIDRL